MKNLLAYCDAHLAGTLETIETLVRLESPSTDKAAVDRCGTVLAEMLRKAGAAVEVLSQPERGNHLRARFPPSLSRASARQAPGDRPPVMFLGHFDTVWPVGTLERMPLRRDGDRLH